MSVWGEIIIPIAIGPLFIVGKYIWDQLHDREQDILRRKHSKQLEMWERQMKEFYWPFYLALTENQQLWKYAMTRRLVQGASICKGDETDSSESEGEEDDSRVSGATVVPSFDTGRCAHYYIKSKHQCGVPISKHQKRLFGSYCMAHFILHKVEEETVVWKSNHIRESSNILVEDSNKKTETELQTLYDAFDTNHQKLTAILEEHLPIISSRSPLGKYMIQFQQYMVAFTLVNRTRDPSGIHNPRKQGAPYPKRLVVYVESKLFTTQKKLYERTENFYADLDKSPKNISSLWCCICRPTPL